MRIGLAILVLILLASKVEAQSCSGRGGLFAFQGSVRERHVVRSHSVARPAGCLGSVAYVVADVPPKAPAPAAAPQKMPVGPHPIVVAYPQTAEPRFALVGASFFRLPFAVLCKAHAIVHGTVTRAVGIVAAPVRRVTVEKHILRSRCH